jgi:nitrite reductase (NADH) small subunit
MAEFIRVAAESELPKEGQVCEMAGGGLCVVRVGGELTVMDGVCPHNEGPLGQGMVENGRVVCPYHGWAFDVKTGEAEHNPAAKVRIYEWTIQNGEFLVKPPDRV